MHMAHPNAPDPCSFLPRACRTDASGAHGHLAELEHAYGAHMAIGGGPRARLSTKAAGLRLAVNGRTAALAALRARACNHDSTLCTAVLAQLGWPAAVSPSRPRALHGDPPPLVLPWRRRRSAASAFPDAEDTHEAA